MKEKQTLKKVLAFYLNECETVSEYLEGMALKGWKLKEIDKAFLQIEFLPKIRYVFLFEKSAPQKLIYTVEIIDKFSPKQSIQEFIDYCKEAGWDHVFTFEMLNICNR